MLFLFFQVFIYASSNENKKSTTNLQSSMNENRSIEQQLSKNSNMHKCISFKTNNKHSADEHSKDYNPENFTRCREKIKKKVESKIPIKVGSDIVPYEIIMIQRSCKIIKDHIWNLVLHDIVTFVPTNIWSGPKRGVRRMKDKKADNDINWSFS